MRVAHGKHAIYNGHYFSAVVFRSRQRVCVSEAREKLKRRDYVPDALFVHFHTQLAHLQTTLFSYLHFMDGETEIWGWSRLPKAPRVGMAKLGFWPVFLLVEWAVLM